MEILAKYQNIEYGIESQVATHEKGYSVVLFDTDAEMFLDTVVIFPEYEKAINKAKELVK